LEETGLRVVISRLFGVYSRAGNHVVNVVYLANPLNVLDKPVLTREALEIASFYPDEIPWAELAFPSTTLVLQDWVALARTVRPAD
jgi:ADP-ribose pyrophosphatase YjhB (NUDIX family)